MSRSRIHSSLGRVHYAGRSVIAKRIVRKFCKKVLVRSEIRAVPETQMGTGFAEMTAISMNNAERREFEDALGKENAIFGDEVAQRYHWCTTPLDRKIEAVLQPSSVEEVCAIVRIAAAHNIALYPISTVNNCCYVTSQPVRDNNVIVDLGRINRIL